LRKKGSPSFFSISAIYAIINKEVIEMAEEKVTYKEIHAYMLQKTKEYYDRPPKKLVEDVIAAYQAQGDSIDYDTAAQRVSLINIQRFVKEEMAQKWPEFMGGIPSNGLPKTVD